MTTYKCSVLLIFEILTKQMQIRGSASLLPLLGKIIVDHIGNHCKMLIMILQSLVSRRNKCSDYSNIPLITKSITTPS